MNWFKKLICKIKGHHYVPVVDVNKKYSSDVCLRCGKVRKRIIQGGLR